MGEDRILGYTENELMNMDPMVLRAIIRERTHHTIEVLIYRIIAGKMAAPPGFGDTVERLLDIWRRRGLPTDAPDIKWALNYLGMARMVRSGGALELEVKPPEPFKEDEMRVVERLLYGRRSIRQWLPKPVPDELVRRVLYAGLMAPQGCNIGAIRFIVLREPEEWKLVQSDIPLENGVMILICQDMRLYQALGFDKRVPQNIYFDAAAAADHMLLMAHALGLGGVWLTHGEETQKRIREYFGLPETFVSRCHIFIGWPPEAPIKSARLRLEPDLV
ncbi:nitroreductase family protein, partial [Candidatus Bathyarchaeota archaeon]|nr:nitroreductase family protein [Candidatus Bathyarchaeota archaeon]